MAKTQTISSLKTISAVLNFKCLEVKYVSGLSNNTLAAAVVSDIVDNFATVGCC